MADETSGPKSLTDMMHEINSRRRYQHRTFKGQNGVDYMVLLFAFNVEECLEVIFHDVRQPLCNYTWEWSAFAKFCGIVDEEQAGNKLPEEMAAEAAQGS